MGMGYSLFGILVLIGDIWALINILQSSAANDKKILWVIVVVLGRIGSDRRPNYYTPS